MPPRRAITPPPLEELCLIEVMNYLEKELILCSQVRRYQHNSLLLRRRGIDADSLVAELRCHLDCLPPLLSEMVRQQMTNKLLKNSESMANYPGLVVGMLDIVLNKEVKILEMGDFRLCDDFEIWPLVLKKCTGLERFVLGSNMFISKGVLAIQPFLSTLTSNCPMLTELILKDAVRSSHTLYAIGKSCHRLRTLDITGSQVSCSDLVHLFVHSPVNVLNFSAFKKLRCLTLENIHFEDIVAGLRHTPNLVQLEISSTGVDFGIVGQCCPLLEKLIVSKEPSRTVTLQNMDTLIYTELQELKMTCTISLECGAMFFTNATKLRSIEIIRIQGLSDDILASWLNRNPLQLLEVLLLSYVELTKESVHLLLACCPCLTRLGELGSWDVRSWECRRLKDLVEQQKYDLHLVFYTGTSVNISDILTENSTSEDEDMEEQ